MNAKVVAVKLPADFSLQRICVSLLFSRGRRKVTSLTADLAPASLHAYLKSGFGKTVPMSVFPESDAAAWILIVHSHSSISDICSSGRKMQQTYQTYSNEDVFRRHRQSVESTSDKATDRIIVVGVKELVFHILKPNHGGLGLWKMPEICFGWGRLGAHLNLHTFARGLWEHHPSLICGLLRPGRWRGLCVTVCVSVWRAEFPFQLVGFSDHDHLSHLLLRRLTSEQPPAISPPRGPTRMIPSLAPWYPA